MAGAVNNDYISMINKKGSGYNIPVIVEAIVNSEIDPKHAKPAFLVLAPFGKISRSKIAILALGFFILKDNAENRPEIPPPMTIKS